VAAHVRLVGEARAERDLRGRRAGAQPRAHPVETPQQ